MIDIAMLRTAVKAGMPASAIVRYGRDFSEVAFRKIAVKGTKTEFVNRTIIMVA